MTQAVPDQSVIDPVEVAPQMSSLQIFLAPKGTLN